MQRRRSGTSLSDHGAAETAAAHALVGTYDVRQDYQQVHDNEYEVVEVTVTDDGSGSADAVAEAAQVDEAQVAEKEEVLETAVHESV